MLRAMYIYTYICIYMYMYIYTHTYIHVYRAWHCCAGVPRVVYVYMYIILSPNIYAVFDIYNLYVSIYITLSTNISSWAPILYAVYVCMYVCMYVYIYMYIYIYIHIYIYYHYTYIYIYQEFRVWGLVDVPCWQSGTGGWPTKGRYRRWTTSCLVRWQINGGLVR